MTALYNEIDPKAAAWLRALISAGHIAPGIVNEQSIEDLTPDYLRQFTQVHFFAGIGVWSYALRAAGWPDDRPVWTGSCPCQPFSAAGKGGGFDDERHLWPAFHWLISQCRPPVVFGEQVASKDGLGWLDLVQADLEGTGYASGAVDLCAAGVGAPHIRQRLWWYGERLADANEAGATRHGRDGGAVQAQERLRDGFADSGRAFGLGDNGATGLQERISYTGVFGGEAGAPEGQTAIGGSVYPGGMAQPESIGSGAGLRDIRPAGDGSALNSDRGPVRGVADASVIGRDGRRASRPCDEPGAIERPNGLCPTGEGSPPAGPTNGLWSDADWLHCRDGKWRPVEPGTFPLAHGAAERVGRLRGYGNAIVAPAAQVFIQAYLDATVNLTLP